MPKIFLPENGRLIQIFCNNKKPFQKERLLMIYNDETGTYYYIGVKLFNTATAS